MDCLGRFLEAMSKAKLLAQQALACCGCLAALSANGQLFVSATVTPVGPLFHYEISVQNLTAEDVVLVTLSPAPLADPNINPSLQAPVGFEASYDAGLGLVDLVSDTLSFGIGTTVNGFSFDSVASPEVSFTNFEALGELGALFAGEAEFTVVPEPQTWAAALALAGFALARTARKLCIGVRRIASPRPSADPYPNPKA
jgi:hypothetical protein